MERISEIQIINKVPIPVFWSRHIRIGEDLIKKKAVLCPFHNDRNPSMVYNPKRKIIKCYSCGAGGNIIQLAMKHFNFTKEKALEFLVNEYKVKGQSFSLDDILDIAENKKVEDNIRLAKSKLLNLCRVLNNNDVYLFLDIIMSIELEECHQEELYKYAYKEIYTNASNTRDYENLLRSFLDNINSKCISKS